ncbi:TIGR03986 family type III CRISPR-associated RAMP protein [Lacihabitans lacunae]|uniref:TIGR03986 family CRISPR-associated RAMP protein n=1 Tax=Lacihabitans lacunae TaxID=1028214 RepID=A0ABV7YSD7_9BACT
MEQVKSPYNFVPAPSESEVFKPEWADLINHDIPFEDGESGEIDITITAETPIFIRNGHSQPSEGTNPTSEFSHIMVNDEKKYFIPATSIKGMLRNVLEIMSLSRMKQVGDNKFSIRDLSSNSNYYMSQMKSTDGNKTHCGWLSEDSEGNWSILDCDEPGRISHLELKEKFGLGFRDEFLNKEPKNEDAKTAKYKYLESEKQPYFNLKNKFRTLRQDTRLKVWVDTDGDETGTIVFTGQPGKRKELGDDKKRFNGKFYEFVFLDKNSKILKLTQKQKQEFLYIYNDSDKNNISKDWEFWRNKLANGEKVPVFFKVKKHEILHFGLSYLYKLPLECSIHEVTPFSTYKRESLDLTETIFGVSNNDSSLKGRVFISNAFAQNPKELSEQKEILGGPKASYLPFYLDQTEKTGLNYSNYNSKSILRGFKRYPVRNNIRAQKYSDLQLKNKNVFSHFIPLEKGTIFKGKIRFHNLRKVEIGALISTLTFHNTDSLYHSIGGVKGFGYGKIKIEVNNLSDYFKNLMWFESEMNSICKADWLKTPQIKELFSIASNPAADVEQNLIYPMLEDSTKSNEFVKYKQSGEYLKSYSIYNGSKKVETTLENSEIILLKSEIAKAKEINDLEKIETLYNTLKEIDPSFDFKKEFNELQNFRKNLEKENLEKEEIDNGLNTSDLDIILALISKYPISDRIKSLRAKELEIRQNIKLEEAKKLGENNLDLKSLEFSKIKDYLNGFSKKNRLFEFSENQKIEITEWLKKSYNAEKQNKKSDWNKNPYPKYPWSDISKWLGDEQAKELHKQLIG